jgi:hypothetical protein
MFGGACSGSVKLSCPSNPSYRGHQIMADERERVVRDFSK